MDAAWVEVLPSGTATWTQSNGVMSVVGGGHTSDDLAVLVKPLPVLSPRTIETAVRMFGVLDNYLMVGLILTDGTSVTSNAVSTFLFGNSTAGSFLADRRSGTITDMTSNTSQTSIHAVGPWVHMRLGWLTVNVFNVEYSLDGVSWTTMGLSALSTTFTPTHAGLCFSTWGSGNTKIGTFEYYRTR